LLGLLSFVLIWPLAYLVRKLRKLPLPKQAPAAIAWSAPVLVIGVGGLSLLFVIGLIMLAFSSDLSVLLVGIPQASAPLFIAPVLLLLLTVGLVIVTLAVWIGGYWSAWQRVYYSLLALSAVVFVGVLAQWGMLTVFL
jgi:hypothetical protein